jgi:hypothetical protein
VVPVGIGTNTSRLVLPLIRYGNYTVAGRSAAGIFKSIMTSKEVEFGSALSGPVSDGLDAIEPMLAAFYSSSGQTKEKLRRALFSLKLMFSRVAPVTLGASRWNELEPKIDQAIG